MLGDLWWSGEFYFLLIIVAVSGDDQRFTEQDQVVCLSGP